MFYFCILLSFIYLFFAKKTYIGFSPGKLFSYYWAGQILVVIICGHDFFYLNYEGIFFILICLFFFNIGANTVTKPSISIERRYKIVFNEDTLLKLLCVFTVLGFIKPIETVISHGFNLASLIDFSVLLEVNNDLSLSRYSGEQESGSLFTQLLGVFSNISPLFGGFMLILLKNTRKKLICYLTFLPPLFGSLTQGAKMGMIAAVFLFLSGYMSNSILIGKKISLGYKKIIYAGFAVLTFFSILILSMMFRTGTFDIETFELVGNKFITYALGHLPAFDIWFAHQDILTTNITLGGKIFLGITNFLGVMSRDQGLYLDFYSISKTGDETNVFTIYRLMIDDFSILGAPFFCVLLGRFGQKIYNKVRCLAQYKIYTSLLVAFYFFIFWSFATSAFVYTTYIVTFVLFYIILAKYSKKVPI